MWLAVLVSTLGQAQTPITIDPRGEARWLTEDVEADRFYTYDGESKGVKLFKGDEVELVVANGDRVRIKKGTRYGWVSATVLTAEAPEDDLVPANRLSNPALLAPAN